MPPISTKLRTGPTWTADRRLYLDKDGKVVEATDPARLTLLVAEKGTLPIDRARELGLVKDEVPPPAGGPMTPPTTDAPRSEGSAAELPPPAAEAEPRGRRR